MTLTFTRAAIALAIALGLAGCGGKASFTIGGTVEGLQYQGLVLNTNGMDLAVPASTTSTTTTFAFPNSLSYGDVYDVTVKTQPAHESCTVGAFVAQSGVMLTGASDTAGRLSAIIVGVQCALTTHSIGGTVTGLTSEGLILTNGSLGGQVTVTAAAPTFTFANGVPFNVSYGVTVLAQPAGDVCTVTQKGTAIMTDDPVTDILVTCVKKT
jgi:hypothetical protein